MAETAINHFGISGGKDSTALLLWALYESGYPPDTLWASFANTMNEHDWTYDYVRMLSEKYFKPVTGRHIEWIQPPLGFVDLAMKKRRFPARKSRFCTQLLKMKPTQAYLYALMDQLGGVPLLHSGVRAAESAERAKLEPRGFNDYMALPVYRPLLNWTIDDVWAIHKRYGVKPNPLYAMGARRVGCFPCINSCKAEIRMIATKFPERIAQIRQIEQNFQKSRNKISTFFARKTVPLHLRSKEITTADGRTMKVCTIDDVVEWSKTARGGRQYELLFDEVDFSDDDFAACPNTFGVCE